MDLTSLPDEMLANVLKYSDYITTNILRKINSRVANVAKAYEIGTRLPVTLIDFSLSERSRNSDADVQWICRMDIDLPILRYIKYLTQPEPRFVWGISLNYESRDGHHLKIVNNILSRIELNGFLQLTNFLNIDDQLVDCFLKNLRAFRYSTFLRINCTKIDCSPSLLGHFIKSAGKLNSLDFVHAIGDMDVIFKADIFANRQWKKIRLAPKREGDCFPPHRMNDEFLLNIVRSCNSLICESENSFTVEGVIKLIKDCIIGDDVKRSVHLGYVKYKQTSLEMVQKQIRSIDETNIECNFKEEWIGLGVLNSCGIHRPSNSSELYFILQNSTNVD